MQSATNILAVDNNEISRYNYWYIKTSGENLLGFIAHNAGGRMSAILPNNSVIHRVDVAPDPTRMAIKIRLDLPE